MHPKSTNTPLPLILGSSSPYRRAQIERLGLKIACIAPDIDESPLAHETPNTLALRLASEKAYAIAESTEGLIISGDQTLDFEGEVLGKPGTREKAIQQLMRFSGKSLTFHSAICVLNTATGKKQLDSIETNVFFRELSADAVRFYIDVDNPLDCAGSFKNEQLGIALFSRVDSNDPSALTGLPLITLISFLANEGVNVLG